MVAVRHTPVGGVILDGCILRVTLKLLEKHHLVEEMGIKDLDIRSEVEVDPVTEVPLLVLV